MSKPATPPAQDITTWVWHSLMALFSIGFIAWAAAVWHATTLVAQHDEQMKALDARLDHIEADVRRLEDRLTR